MTLHPKAKEEPMRRLVQCVAVAGLIAAGGCATLPSGAPTAAQVEGAAVALCSYLPDAASVAGLLSANGAIMTAEAIAQIICAAVGPAPALNAGVKRKASAPVTVIINGKRVAVTRAFVAAVKGRRLQR
jgi:hypothetical protein